MALMGEGGGLCVAGHVLRGSAPSFSQARASWRSVRCTPGEIAAVLHPQHLPSSSLASSDSCTKLGLHAPDVPAALPN
eukprot:CAMPEP_0174321580 /NCGR_PEP_ID=MMETSP0810-20121108/10413_1 /TAXON_ID=73025 ORGANISM="Eutreptiella gymnastica-like, Strain CCMP1594" /NCGR_SAMPLE_ID=MMETSP0810 /ASSEMBLY_ACC=CAM_ASM_000659 /LENGTH=77 /DNA_ID=CAMNT_0015433077 /DNA_START=295 /DNA_END=528 /DNA_ORIENTATION=-